MGIGGVQSTPCFRGIQVTCATKARILRNKNRSLSVVKAFKTLPIRRCYHRLLEASITVKTLLSKHDCVSSVKLAVLGKGGGREDALWQ
jgi:hypothetical protein